MKFIRDILRSCHARRACLLAALLSLLLLTACWSQSSDSPPAETAQVLSQTSEIAATLIAMPNPAPTPVYLTLLQPAPGSVLTQAQFEKVIPIEDHTLIVLHGTPGRLTEMVGLRSSICFHLDAKYSVEPGDALVTDTDILSRIESLVNGIILDERAETNYAVVIEPGPVIIYFDPDSDDTNWRGGDSIFRNESSTPPPSVGIYFWPGFWYCYPVALDPGIHTVTFNFTRKSGRVESYSWFFALFDND